MFKRVRDSLVYPKEILRYRKDNILLVLLYLLFFALLLSSRTVIDVIKYDGLSGVYKEGITQEMTVVNQDCAIENAVLVCDGEHLINLYSEQMFTVYLDSSIELDFTEYPDDEYGIIIHDEHVFLYLFGMNTMQIPLSDFPTKLQDIDFDDQVNNSTVFYDDLFEGIDELLVSYKTIWGPLLLFVEVSISIAFYLVFVLVSAWFLKMRFKVIPYKETFTLTAYSSTSLFIILTFYSMLNLDLIIIIILLIISFRQNGIMSKEIERRLKKKS